MEKKIRTIQTKEVYKKRGRENITNLFYFHVKTDSLRH